ncbi:MAG TPA: imelysin family protein [Polyangiaceae bacterium]|nr:imelysin family protein [Polyangiaceae bacterium]
MNTSLRHPFRISPRRFSRWVVGGLLGLGGLLGALPACTTKKDNGTSQDIRRELLQGLGEQIFVSRYAELVESVDELVTASRALCTEPSEEALQAAQAAWWASRAPLKRNELLSFGPWVDEPLRLGPLIDFWPSRPDAIEALLAGSDELSTAALAARGSSERGSPVIEYLLYRLPEAGADVVEGAGGAGGAGGAANGGGGEMSPEEAFAPEGRRCLYLIAAAEDLAAQTLRLHDAWDPKGDDFLSELSQAGRDKKFETIDLAMSEVVSRLAFTIENVRGAKLGVPVGKLATAQPDSMESRFSGRSLEDIRDNLRGVEEVIFGADVDDAQSLAKYLEYIGEEALVPSLRTAFDDSYAGLDTIGDPLREHVEDDRDDVLAAIDTLAVLQRLIQVDMIHAMNLQLTFNDVDGD